MVYFCAWPRVRLQNKSLNGSYTMLFNKNELLARARSLKYFALANEKVAMDSLDVLSEGVSSSKRFDIFLSHS